MAAPLTLEGAWKHVALLAAALGLSAAAAADEPQTAVPADGGFRGEVAVTIVNVDVMVRNRDRRPVEGLTAEDFRVTQDGVEMPISNFDAFSTPVGPTPSDSAAPPSGLTERPHEIRPPIHVVVYVDSANLHPLQRKRVLDRVQTFARQQLSPPLQMMVVATRPSLEIRQPFTDDPEAVVAALKVAAGESAGRFTRDADRRRILDWLHRVGSDRRALSLQFTQQPDIMVAKAQLQGEITAWIQQETFALADAIERLREALGLFSGLEGRRSLIYISSGLAMNPGIGLLHEYSTVFRDPSIFSRVPQLSLVDRYRGLAVAANRAGVSLYTLDASGLQPPEGFQASDSFAPGAMTSAYSLDDLQGSLRYLAETTGGIPVVNSNDPTAGLERIADDLVSWYSIGYAVAATAAGDVAHRLEVELPTHPELTIRARRWHVESSPETRLVDQVLAQLARKVEANPMGLRLDTGTPVADGGRRWIVPVRVSVPLRHLALTAENEHWIGEVEVCVAVRDDRGKLSDPARRSVHIRVPEAGYDPGREQRYAVELQLAVRNQGHVVAAGVLDRTSGLISSTRTRLELP